jgi:hypothetical protein
MALALFAAQEVRDEIFCTTASVVPGARNARGVCSIEGRR